MKAIFKRLNKSSAYKSDFCVFGVNTWRKFIEFNTYQDFSLILTMIKVLRGPLCCLLYTSPSPRDRTRSRMPSSA